MTTASTSRTATPAATRLLSKVPQVTASFWVVKILTTGMGETAADFMSHGIGPAIAVVISGTGLLVSLALQLRSDRYRPWTYWFAVVMVSVFGTLAADGVRVGLGVPYVVSTVAFAIALAAVLGAWYLSERTLAMHSIVTRRRELFYWLTVMTTFALGTALGDWTATSLGLGYLASGIGFVLVFAVPAVAYRWFGLNAVVAFWSAYIVTRPLGASFSDWLALPTERGGQAFGTLPVTLVLTAVIVVLVAGLARRAGRTPAQ